MRPVVHAIGRFLLTIVFGVPRVAQVMEKQCIVVANHNTHIDTFILFRLFPLSRVSSVRVVAAKDYFGKGLCGLVGRSLFNLILVDRAAPNAEAAMAPINEALRRGESLILFPEGSRGEPGVLQRFKTGIGKIAMDFPDIPVFPVFLHGIEKTLPKGGFFPVPFTVRVQPLSPMYGRKYLDEGVSKGRKSFTVSLEHAIRSIREDQD